MPSQFSNPRDISKFNAIGLAILVVQEDLRITASGAMLSRFREFTYQSVCPVVVGCIRKNATGKSCTVRHVFPVHNDTLSTIATTRAKATIQVARTRPVQSEARAQRLDASLCDSAMKVADCEPINSD